MQRAPGTFKPGCDVKPRLPWLRGSLASGLLGFGFLRKETPSLELCSKLYLRLEGVAS